MSINVVDAVIEYANTEGRIGLIPSRRQVENTGGYVNNWKTEEFTAYVRHRSEHVFIQRDHAGPGQGYHDDNGIESLEVDAGCLDAIHIDPWKKYPTYVEGLAKTVELINIVHAKNPNILFEVGTEEAIRKFEIEEFDRFLSDLERLLAPDIHKNIRHAVVQSGTGLDLGKMRNTGEFNPDRLNKMVDICRLHNVKSKEHNGDYLSPLEVKARFDIGLDSINIAPEFGQLETLCYLEEIDDKKALQTMYEVCYNSKRWKKWVSPSFVPHENKKELIKICGHYILSHPNFLEVKPDIDNKIKKVITRRLHELHQT